MIWLLLFSCAEDPTSSPTTPTTPPPGTVTDADRDGDGHEAPADCDDADNTVFPGAPERCDGEDQDCDGAVDEGFDVDGDGWLTDLDPGCATLGRATDCDDRDRDVRPDAEERCNGVDDDCDGELDPTDDEDGDLVPVCDDCDDGDPGVSPDAVEVCNGIDDDCNGLSDEGFDADFDGWGACLDCDEEDPVVHPGAVEVCDRKDNDCDDEWDEGFDADQDGFLACRGDCDDTNPDVRPAGIEVCNGLDDDCNGTRDDVPDRDRDGFLACDPQQPDCDDERGWIHPTASEVCDGRDDDCDGVVPADELDADGDLEPICAGDCDDSDPLRASGLVEVCDGLDNDCDPSTDEQIDADGDRRSVCQGDCDDARQTSFPGAPERCNGFDDDCDGAVDQAATCEPCEVETHEGHTYLFCEDRSTWDEARDACRADGYELVTVDDELENDWVTDTAELRFNGPWWSGLHDRTREGDFEWVSGEPLTYENWAAGEPNDNGGQDCALLRFSGHRWGDAACDEDYRYVCEVAR